MYEKWIEPMNKKAIELMEQSLNNDGNGREMRFVGGDSPVIANNVVQVVRCKDCKHYVLQACACRHDNFNGIISMDGFCSYGERREGE